MKRSKFKITHLLLAILIAAFLLACFVEQHSVVGQSSTTSPDGNWCLKLKLVEHTRLFSSRKTFDAGIEHRTNKDWDVSSSIPFNDADPKTVSNLNQDYPIVWSDDSSTVTYWINENLEDSMKIETGDGEFRFQRKLYSMSVTHKKGN